MKAQRTKGMNLASLSLVGAAILTPSLVNAQGQAPLPPAPPAPTEELQPTEASKSETAKPEEAGQPEVTPAPTEPSVDAPAESETPQSSETAPDPETPPIETPATSETPQPEAGQPEAGQPEATPPANTTKPEETPQTETGQPEEVPPVENVPPIDAAPPVDVPTPSVPTVGKTPSARVMGSISGTVNGEDGQPLAHATLRIGAAYATTDAVGQFTLSNVRNGNVYLFARAEGYLAAVQPVEVLAEGTAPVTMTLSKLPSPVATRGTLHGRVVSNATGEAVVGALVQLGDRTALTNAAGEFLLEGVEPGQAKLEVSAPGLKKKAEVVPVLSGRNTEKTVNLDREITPAAPEGTGKAAGSVTTPEGLPVPGAVLRFTGADGATVTVTTDEMGRYLRENAPVGPVKVEVIKPGFQSVEEETLVAAEGTAEVSFALSRKPAHSPTSNGSVSGTVYDAAGLPVVGATVMLRGLRTVTDAEGRYEFTELPGKNFTVQIWADGFRHTFKKAQMTGGSLPLDVTLHPKRTETETPEAPVEEDLGGDEFVGDANGDGETSVADAISVLRMSVGLGQADARAQARLDVAPSKARGDFGDGKVDVRDVMKLLRVAIKIDQVSP